MTSILVVDNYDSFVYTIVGYLDQLGARTTVVRNDAVPEPDADGRYRTEDGTAFDGVLISPGPGTPKQAGASEDVIRACARSTTPMLGVCLGHQALAEVYGATVSHAPELMHGKTSEVEHRGVGVLAGLGSPFTATRYHSLAVEPHTVPAELEVTGATASGVVMGLQHRELPLHGVQFHPESVLTEGGHRLLANWLAVCGDAGAVERSAGMAPLVHAA
ncbi:MULTISPECIES: aminodeoxychorismate/anthranilate synthase component II [Isoptericola]|uniref:Aminodeoxychorismate/anthranilate synthase component II n=1 Tax=Isoptericola sediminis TaxID=2733572 RepID=A0A849K475_9MICO|nr:MULTISPECIES: aminodeoxychorismate/anthranilate synthase component II [Isoptericola]MDO8143740.1 aminodeoxychorismate/anthranilate synthase component II [Isoptericola sp. 178]MDO8147641.1 aminodeoxychorismate/anthranilate synthase component II [Isoptericola sp. b515]MDO8150059.1 aminodeoxychorismate/anthranilate synthase component II [Isoptericola sp. b408]NNU27190.1 aminodeoxychorismate/anthranilate synthase component II [Isoptericola sediminis]